MKKLVVVIGLPASGKSHLLKKWEAMGNAFWICEDFHADARNDSPEVTDSKYLVSLLEHLNQGFTCAVADIAFCDPVRL